MINTTNDRHVAWAGTKWQKEFPFDSIESRKDAREKADFYARQVKREAEAKAGRPLTTREMMNGIDDSSRPNDLGDLLGAELLTLRHWRPVLDKNNPSNPSEPDPNPFRRLRPQPVDALTGLPKAITREEMNERAAAQWDAENEKKSAVEAYENQPRRQAARRKSQELLDDIAHDPAVTKSEAIRVRQIAEQAGHDLGEWRRMYDAYVDRQREKIDGRLSAIDQQLHVLREKRSAIKSGTDVLGPDDREPPARTSLDDARDAAADIASQLSPST